MHAYPSPIGVKFGSIRARRTLDATTSIAVCAIVTVLGKHSAQLLALHIHRTAFCRVQGHLVSGCGRIVGFHDIDLTIRRPVPRVRQPQGRPSATAVWRVEDIEDEEPIVVGLLGLDPNGSPASRGINGGSVDLEHGRRV